MNRAATAGWLVWAAGLAWQAPGAAVVWNFDAELPSSNGVPQVAAGALSRGNGGAAQMLTDTSPSSGYAGASGGSNAVASAAGGPLSTNTSAYFQFTLTPDAGSVLRLTGLSLGVRSTATGPQAYCLRGSLDGFASDLAAGAIAAGSDSVWARKDAALAVVSAVAGGAVTFRLYGYGGTGGSLNWRIDDLALEAAAVAPGTVSPPVLAPVAAQAVRLGSALTFALTVLPTDGDAVTATNCTADAGTAGAWSLAGGVFRYTPAAGDVGERTFSFTAADKDGASAPLTVAVTVRRAQVPAVRLSAATGTYTQDFNALATNGAALLWDNAAEPLEAWYAYADAAVAAAYRAGTGSATYGGLYSFGAAAGADRSLGSLAAAGCCYRYGVAFTNATGLTITNLSVRFTAEQWRTASAVPHALAFDCCVTSSVVPLDQGAWGAVSALAFEAPVVTNASQTAGAVYQSAELSAVVTQRVAAGQVVLLRWTDADDAGADHAFGIDDLTVTWAAARGPRVFVFSLK